MTTPSPLAPHGTTPRYRDRIYDDLRHDPYETRGKYGEPALCGTCHAVYHRGRWTWGEAPEDARTEECPACHRIRDKQPAGFITLTGAAAEREALIALIRHVERHENVEHPLHRIIGIEQREDELRVTTTDVHLPQRIGEAVRKAHHGHLDIVYAQDEYVVRAHWRK